MAYKLEIKQEATEDVLDGFLWYEGKNEGLGSKFINEVEQSINYIANYPNHFQIRRRNYREAVLKKFPYVIIYEVFKNNIVVYSVFPCKDDPNKKLR